jgi:chromatin remodeling complex protein RSC6
MSSKATAKMMKKLMTKAVKSTLKKIAATPIVAEVKGPRVFPEVQLSPQLSQLVNATTLSRPEALKALWAYIK